ncbi:SGNH/GDSL hydrolase family protein [Natronoglycomyces albus]|uniref:SGNH/GDSL hydrolase family protein n=1 Tax=Natronoglycomyces albus TaxID=2811108 RepID=A0A895XRZ8_9ACTN|nr:SGNH/GDSL hydrolase family protein [Natronoglycomyces albus]QSB05965.1 SGNH/GDSL hydrolase family protein [Natronoglycomyces albus]
MRPSLSERPARPRTRRSTLIGTIASAAMTALLLTFTPTAALAQEQAEPIQYVALGDSYSSGVGAGGYLFDDLLCFRSEHAHPFVYAESIGAELDFQACGGATIPDVHNKQLGALSPETDLVSMGIGGNDTGWVGVLLVCALPWSPTCHSQIAQAEEYVVNELPGELDALYAAVRDNAPNAEVVITGYPRLFNGTQCQCLVNIAPDDQELLNDAADLLNDVIAGVAAEHGFTFADVRDNFDGHAVCDDVEYLHGLTAPLLIESFHPNWNGQTYGYLPALQEAMAQFGHIEDDASLV